MQPMASSTVPGAPRLVAAILVGGLSAGALDIVYAFVVAEFRGVTPLRVLQSVASGLLGASSYQGGLATGAMGLFLHFGIALVAAGVYFAVARQSSLVQRCYLVFGAIFGVLVYLTMNFVVIPLSAIQFRITYSPQVLAQGFVSHALLFGIPIAFFLHRMYFNRMPAGPRSEISTAS
ncbi:MAG: hypothetical protein NT159_09380 [Proteobacteria bacterium]|nr:hypothetical protein [Pseudomonadota bacterium]